MKKLLFALFALPLLMTACQPSDPVEELEVLPVEETEAEAEAGVEHYSDSYLSFDYPSDLELLVESFGEGALGENITFIEWDETSGAYVPVGPGINVSNHASGAGVEFEKDKTENREERVLTGGEAYTVFNEFTFCENYSSFHFLFTNGEEDPYGRNEFYGLFDPHSICPGDRYQEILDMFMETVSI